MENIFSYGTLQKPGVQQEVFGRHVDGVWDTLSDYEAEPTMVIEGVSYLCATPREGSKLSGLVLAVSPEDVARADAYEGETYRRISVVLESGTQAWMYIRAV